MNAFTPDSQSFHFVNKKPVINEIKSLAEIKIAGIYSPAVVQQLRNVIQEYEEVG